MTLHKHRIVHPLGQVEFLDLAAAEAYRDAHHPGCDIVQVAEDIPDPQPE